MGCSQSTENTTNGGASPGVDNRKPGTTKTTTKNADPASSQPERAVSITNGGATSAAGGGSVSTVEPHEDDVNSIRSNGSFVTPSRTSAGRGRSSGSNTPTDDRSDASSVGSSNGMSTNRRNPRSIAHSSSIIGLDTMIESRREEGGLTANVVHMEVPFGKPIEEVYDGVHTGPLLGSGISGLVRLVTHKATGVKYAVKCLDLGLVDTEKGLAQLREEIFIMCQLDHPNIVRLEEVYESHTEIYLVQELCVGGELFDRLDEQPDYRYTEAECARLIKQMLCAVRYLHSKGIIHRDLKLENFLFSSTAADSELKMIDFGLSKHFRYGEVQHEAVGTPYTVAPEVIRGCYDERCDIWAIGVITFLLLSGEPPFGGCGGPEPLLTVRSNILRGNFKFEPSEIWDRVSPNARHFISVLLLIDPKARPTAQDAQEHSWVKEWANRARSENDQVLNPNVVKALVSFKEFSDMRKLLCEVLSFTLLPEQIKDLRKEFETLDTDGSGEISLSALKQVLVTNAGSGSLGALTEEEVEDIFNAMRVKKTETRIHWHEFIAAGLSQCEVDDRNLRLAFDRLDNDHKGYVTLDDILDLVGSDAQQDEEAMRKMWRESMKACNCSTARITYDDFVLIMKGQTKENEEEKDQFGPLMDTAVHEESTVSSLLPPIPNVPDKDIDLPLSMDDDEDLPTSFPTTLTPLKSPGSPRRSAPDLALVPENSFVTEGVDLLRVSKTPSLSRPKLVTRQKSRSMGESEMKIALGLTAAQLHNDALRAVALPEHDPELRDAIINNTNVTALQSNRKLYRAHRQMRLAVTEASKRFEEQQARHAREFLIAQEEEKNNNGGKLGAAGLVMRRVQNKTVPSEAILNLLDQNRKEQQDLMEKASLLCGRGKRTRKKTISDIGGMMGSLFQEEMTNISIQASEANPLRNEPIPPIIETKPMPDDDADADTNLRGATVPGEFRRVNDPFGMHGKYAAMVGDNVA